MIEGIGSISVVICAYTEERWLDLVAAVASIRNQTLQPREIIAVIDHDPQLLARARDELKAVTVVENRGLRGLSGARNSGIAVASGDVIAFIDEDATASPDWLVWLSRHYSDPQVLGVGGAIEPVWQSGRPKWFPSEFDWVVGCTYRGMPETAHRVRNLIGCNMSFRREVFQRIAGFRSGIGRIGTYPAGCEETELCIRLNQHQSQAQLLYEPRSQVFHQVPSGRARWRYFVSRCYAEGFSKALVSRFVGTSDGLSSERVYALRTLPRGILRGLADAIRRHDMTGLARAAVIVIGLTVTAIGYLCGQLSLRLANVRATNGSINLSSEQL